MASFIGGFAFLWLSTTPLSIGLLALINMLFYTSQEKGRFHLERTAQLIKFLVATGPVGLVTVTAVFSIHVIMWLLKTANFETHFQRFVRFIADVPPPEPPSLG